MASRRRSYSVVASERSMLCVSWISESVADALWRDCSTAAWVVSWSSRSVRAMVFAALCVAISAVSRSSLIERETASLVVSVAAMWLVCSSFSA